jgi:hypothetical protein
LVVVGVVVVFVVVVEVVETDAHVAIEKAFFTHVNGGQHCVKPKSPLLLVHSKP